MLSSRGVTTARLRGAEPGADFSGVDVDTSGDEWIDAVIPGDVRAALVAAGRLTDPDRDPTDIDAQWVDDLEWWYRFDLPATYGAAVLRFDGIDTFATVFVDGVERATSVNMFRVVEVDVTDARVVAVRIDRPWARLGLDSARAFDDRRDPVRTRMRKAQFGYGWDFAPNQPSIGLWRPVTLIERDHGWIDSVRFQTLRIDGPAAVVAVDVFVGGTAERARVELDGAFEQEAPVADGVARVVAVVDNARLWWPHTHGEPALYDLRVELEAALEQAADVHESRVGIRTITLDESPNPDEPGLRFFRFVVNGQPIFAKGANWVPADYAVGCVDEATYQPLLELAVEANMNMVRVWGGGVYEHDAFYEICDELGLLVWQEFMFACNPVDDSDQAFLDDIRAEATDQVRRLRSHPCLAQWCGNNEIEGIAMLRDANLERSPGARIFYEVLPAVVAAEDGVLGYMPTSPMLGNGSEQADRHNWDVWHALRARELAGLDFDNYGEMYAQGVDVDLDTPAGQALAQGMSAEQYLDDISRFPSEFGLRSMPARTTLARWVDEAHLELTDDQIRLRNRDTNGPTNKVEAAMSLVIGRADTLDELTDMSQFTQAEGLKLACEHFRRRWPSCAGTLIWQLNDPWPAPTWSLIDHAGRGKGALAYAARFFAPVLTSFVREDDGRVSLWVVNDTAQPMRDTATVRLHLVDGGDEWSRDIAIDAAPFSSARVATFEGDGADRVLAVTSNVAPTNRFFFVAPKDLQRGAAEVSSTMQTTDDGRVSVTLTSDGYALFAHVLSDDPSVRFDDNYFDLEAGQTRTITSRGPAAIDQLTVRWL